MNQNKQTQHWREQVQELPFINYPLQCPQNFHLKHNENTKKFLPWHKRSLISVSSSTEGSSRLPTRNWKKEFKKELIVSQVSAFVKHLCSARAKAPCSCGFSYLEYPKEVFTDKRQTQTNHVWGASSSQLISEDEHLVEKVPETREKDWELPNVLMMLQGENHPSSTATVKSNTTPSQPSYFRESIRIVARGAGTRWALRSLAIQTILGSCDSPGEQNSSQQHHPPTPGTRCLLAQEF